MEGKQTKAAATPSFLNCAAVITATAPPRLCPVTTTLKEGLAATAALTAAMIEPRLSTQAFQNPWWALQFGQRSVGARAKFTLVNQFRTEREPRKEAMMFLLVRSRAMKPVVSASRELVC